MNLKARTRKLQRDAANHMSEWGAGLSHDEFTAALRFSMRGLSREQVRDRIVVQMANRPNPEGVTDRIMAKLFLEDGREDHA